MPVLAGDVVGFVADQDGAVFWLAGRQTVAAANQTGVTADGVHHITEADFFRSRASAARRLPPCWSKNNSRGS